MLAIQQKIKPLLSVLWILSIFLSNSCTAPETTPPKPVDDGVFQADPTIFFHDGIYYLYGTKDKGPNDGFEVYRSTDLKTWEGPVGANSGFALKKGQSFGDVGFWAPQVWQENGKFYMAYTANENIAVASSNSPLGPFVQTVKRPVITTGKQIDPFIFIDTDGKKYLYHVRLGSGNRIFVAELNADFNGIKTETLKECISAVLPWEKTAAAAQVAEGPTVIKQDGLYYMFYSANDFRNPKYAVGAAVSDNVYGPWTKIGNQALLSIHNSQWAGTGHGDLFKSGNNWMYVCHTHFSNQAITPRRTAIVPMTLETTGSSHLAPKFHADKFKHIEASFIR